MTVNDGDGDDDDDDDDDDDISVNQLTSTLVFFLWFRSWSFIASSYRAFGIIGSIL